MRYLLLKKLLAIILLGAILLNQGLFVSVAFAHNRDNNNNEQNNDNNNGNNNNDEDDDNDENNGNSDNNNSGNQNGNQNQAAPTTTPTPSVQLTPTPEATPTPTATPAASLNSEDDKEKKNKKEEEIPQTAQAPQITGLLSDTAPTPSKTWEWSSDDQLAEFRYTISKSATEELHGPFKDEKTATQDKGDGVYYLHVQAKGSNGVESEVITVSAVLDNTEPSTPGEPTANVGSPTNATTQAWEWQQSSDASQISQYLWWTVDSTTSQVSTEGATISTNTTTNLTEGSWNFFLKSKDKAGNQSDSIGKLLTVDTTKPTGSITSPQNNSIYNSAPEFKATASDSQGIASVTFQYKEKLQTSYTNLNTDTHHPYEASWNNVNLSAGKSYDLQARITDKAGNTIEVSGVSFTHNPNPPVAVNDTVTTYKNTSLSIPVSQLLSNDSDPDLSDLSISSVKKGSHNTVSLSGANVIFSPNQNYVGLANFTYIVTDGNLEATGIVNVSVIPPVEVNQVIMAPKVSLKEEKPQIIVSPTDAQDSTIAIPKDVKNATLDVTNVITTKDNKKFATLSNNITINAETSVGKIKVDLPKGIEINGPSDTWTGVINAPTIIDAKSIAFQSTDLTVKREAAAVVEVGFGDVPLTFNKAVRMIIEGMAGKSAGYSRGDVFTTIPTVCTEDSQTAADALAEGADCRIDVGGDMVIWTKHFTKFIAYTETSTTSSSSSPSTSSSTACADTKPGSAPKLLSASSAGQNSVTLTWNKASDPLSYYVVSYGTISGVQQYGTPYINAQTTSYTINGLYSGTEYFFKVRAGYGCAPGEYSNELSQKPEGSVIAAVSNNTPPFSFEEKTTIIEDIKGALTYTIEKVQKGPSTIDQLRGLGMTGFLIMMLLPFLAIFNFAIYKTRFKQ